MALSASTVFEVRTGGVDTNGGGFVTGASGTDYSQQTSAQYALTNGTTNGTTTVATVSAATDMIGNLAYITGGTGAVAAAWYQITAASAGVSITVDRSTGLTAGTGVTINVGGALLSPGIAASLMTVSNMTAFVKAGTFSITSATNNVAGGTIAPTGICVFIGYNTTRSFGNTDTKPVLQLNVSTANLVDAATVTLNNFALDGNTQTTARATRGGTFLNCSFTGFNTASSQASGATLFNGCSATANSAAVFLQYCANCDAYANTATPFSGTPGIYTDCSSVSNTGASTDGFTQQGNFAGIFVNCVSVSNGRDGFRLQGSAGCSLANCHAESNTGVGFSQSNGIKTLINCSTFSNTGGATSGTFLTVGSLTPSASVFVSAPTNLALNNTAGAGALLRAASYPTTFPRGTTANYRDIGQSQHLEVSSGMLFIPSLEGV